MARKLRHPGKKPRVKRAGALKRRICICLGTDAAALHASRVMDSRRGCCLCNNETSSRVSVRASARIAEYHCKVMPPPPPSPPLPPTVLPTILFSSMKKNSIIPSSFNRRSKRYSLAVYVKKKPAVFFVFYRYVRYNYVCSREAARDDILPPRTNTPSLFIMTASFAFVTRMTVRKWERSISRFSRERGILGNTCCCWTRHTEIRIQCITN